MTNDSETPTVAKAFGRNDLFPEETQTGAVAYAYEHSDGRIDKLFDSSAKKLFTRPANTEVAIAAAYEQGKRDAVPEDIRKDAESWRAYKKRKDEVIAAGMGKKILRDAAAPKQEK